MATSPECLKWEDTFMLEKLAEQNKVIGIKQTTKALNQDKAKTLFIAEDAEKHLVQHLEQTAKEKNIKIVYVDSMKNLGKACGIEVGALRWIKNINYIVNGILLYFLLNTKPG